MIVIPMAGRSRRFTEAGYDRPKHMLPLYGRSVFAHAVGSFAGEFGRTPFLIICNTDVEAFVREECVALGLTDVAVATVDHVTAGQAETVALGLTGCGVDGGVPITIFNIDTFRPGFAFPGDLPDGLDGWLEVFRGEGSNWSYVKPAAGPERIALETAEKRPISDLCCTGLYHFARADDFTWALEQERAAPQATELYVAPLYNHLIRRGARIGYDVIDRAEVIFCGTPAEYEGLLSGPDGSP